jgi:hypothetical protein
MGQPREATMTSTSWGETCIGTKQDLWKLIANPVVEAKSLRIWLRQEAASGLSLQRMRVLSAY